MPRILLTAFEPYEQWPDNSSWATLMELTRWFDSGGKVVTRRYPVDLPEMMHRLGEDLMLGFDYAIHLGQSPGSPAIKMETTGLNLTDAGKPIVANAPAAIRTTLPVERWSSMLCSKGIPTVVSHHAGTYHCNAALYYSLYYSASRGLPTQSVFIHLPVAPHQAAARLPEHHPMPSMSLSVMASGIATLLSELLVTNPVQETLA